MLKIVSKIPQNSPECNSANLPNQPNDLGCVGKSPYWVSVVRARYYVLSHPFTRFSLRLRAQNARKSRAPPGAARERRQHSYSALPGLLFQAFGSRARKRDSKPIFQCWYYGFDFLHFVFFQVQYIHYCWKHYVERLRRNFYIFFYGSH